MNISETRLDIPTVLSQSHSSADKRHIKSLTLERHTRNLTII